MGMLYAAIDIHKHVFQAATLDPSSGELGDQRGGQALSCGQRCCAGEHNQEDSGEASTAVESAEEMRPDGARENGSEADERPKASDLNRARPVLAQERSGDLITPRRIGLAWAEPSIARTRPRPS